MIAAPVARRESHQPVAVREVMTQALNRLAEQRQHATLMDYATWKTIVGAQAARGSQPTSLRRGKLTIRTTDTVLLYELSLRTPQLLAALRRALPERELHEIVFTVGTVQW